MRALLDTNIVYDMLCKHPFDEDGLLRMRIMHAFSDVELWVSAKSYTDLFYLISRELGSEAAHDLLKSTLAWVHVCSVDERDVAVALESRWDDFEDCVVNACAEKMGADYLVTRDKRGFKRARVPHGSASEFMEFVRATTNTSYAIEGV